MEELVPVVLSDQRDKGFDLLFGDVFLEQSSVAVQKSRDRVFRQNVISDLLLHESKLLGDVFLIFSGVER